MARKTYSAFVGAFEEAINTINRDKRAAAEFYVQETKGRDPMTARYQHRLGGPVEVLCHAKLGCRVWRLSSTKGNPGLMLLEVHHVR